MGCCQSTRPADRPTANVEADSDQDQYLYAFILPFAYSDLPSSVIVKVGHTIQPAQRLQQHKNNLGKIPIQCHFPDFGFPCSCLEQCSSEEGHCIKVCKENETNILFLVNMNVTADRDIERVERCVRALIGSPIMNSALDVFRSLTDGQRKKCNETEWVVSKMRTCKVIQREFRDGNFEYISRGSNPGEQFLSSLANATGHQNIRVVCQQEGGVIFTANAYTVPE